MSDILTDAELAKIRERVSVAFVTGEPSVCNPPQYYGPSQGEYIRVLDSHAALAKQAEAERDELAGALCNIWCNRYFTTCKGETLQQSRERCAAEFIDDAMIPLETFDRLIATQPRT